MTPRRKRNYVTTDRERHGLVGRLGLASLFTGMVLLTGCGKSGPESTNCTSTGFATLNDRIEYLQRYVKFRRTYETLDFAIQYSDNSGGMVPGPSDWDVRLVAVVPAAEIADWVSVGTPASTSDADWLKSVPTSLDLSGIKEWYVDGKKIVGVDRAKRIVVYRNTTN
jgi:hypothetical protein